MTDVLLPGVPMLGLGNASLLRVKRTDVGARLLADRHYSRRTPGARDFMGNGEVLVLRDEAGRVVFGWIREQFSIGRAGAHQEGVGCTIFRNESPRRSSSIILEAEEHALARWPDTSRFWTYVDPRQVRSANPGYCFKRAGWRHVGNSANGRLHLLVKEVAWMR